MGTIPAVEIIPPASEGGSPAGLRPGTGQVRPPGSKSLSNRAILLASLAQGESVLEGVLDSQDSRVMLGACQTLGASISGSLETGKLTVKGCAGRWPIAAAQLDCANSGTTLRFLAAVLAASGGHYILDGNSRMRQRPIGDLLAALSDSRTVARDILGTGCPPVEIRGERWIARQIRVRAEQSSQFLSGLLMAAPLAAGPIDLHWIGRVVSEPYVDMTLRIMRQFGVEVPQPKSESYCIPPQMYRSCQLAIEPDATAASYFFAAAAILGTPLVVQGLTKNSIQGDIEFARVLERMGCQIEWGRDDTRIQGRAVRGIDADLNGISDTVMSLAAVACFADGPTTIRNVAHIRHKESDRIADLARELRKTGVGVDELSDGMRIHPAPLRAAIFDTYDDHRLAMSLSLLGLRHPGMRIRDPECVNKTYPKFFQDLAAVTGSQVVEVT